MEKVKKALEDALHIFCYLHESVDYYGNNQNYSDEITATKLALTELEQCTAVEPAQEVPAVPVAWLRKNGFRFVGEIEPQDDSEIPLYTAPPTIENNRKATNIGPVPELRSYEKATLAPPHPGDFGIPKEHWEAAQYYAEYWHENRLKVYGIGGE